MYLFGDETIESTKEEEMNEHFQEISIYLEKQVGMMEEGMNDGGIGLNDLG